MPYPSNTTYNDTPSSQVSDAPVILRSSTALPTTAAIVAPQTSQQQVTDVDDDEQVGGSEQPAPPLSDSKMLEELKLHYDRQLHEYKSKIDALTKLVAKLQYDADTHNARYAEMVAELEAEVEVASNPPPSSGGVKMAVENTISSGEGMPPVDAIPPINAQHNGGVMITTSVAATHQLEPVSFQPIYDSQIVNSPQPPLPPRQAGQRAPRCEEVAVGESDPTTAPPTRGWLSKFLGR